MFKKLIRWILPFVALLAIATVILFTTVLGHAGAAGVPSTGQQKHHVPTVNTTPTPQSHGANPNIQWWGGQ